MRGSGALHGRKIIVTRPEAEDGPLCRALTEEGAEAVLVPLLSIEPAGFVPPAAREIRDSHRIVFTSANAVRCFTGSLTEEASREFVKHPGIAAVGPATAGALTAAGCKPMLVATTHIAESLASDLGDVHGLRILWPRGNLARDILTQDMIRRGATLTEIIVYRTIPVGPEHIAGALRDADAITYTSPSAVEAWFAAFGNTGVRAVCIGPITAQAAARCAISVAAVASPYTLDGLMATLRLLFSSRSGSGTTGA